MPEDRENASGTSPTEDDMLDRTIESSGGPEGEEELGRTIDTPAHEEATNVPSTKTEDQDLGMTITSPPRGTGRPLGPGDTIILAPREIVREFGFLVVWSGPRVGDLFKLEHTRNVIGRDLGSQVFVDDPSASGKHAAIRCEKMSGGSRGEFVLRDLDSENGTSVNGQRIIAATVLKDGDIIRVGQTDLVFKRI